MMERRWLGLLIVYIFKANSSPVSSSLHLSPGELQAVFDEKRGRSRHR